MEFILDPLRLGMKIISWHVLAVCYTKIAAEIAKKRHSSSGLNEKYNKFCFQQNFIAINFFCIFCFF